MWDSLIGDLNLQGKVRGSPPTWPSIDQAPRVIGKHMYSDWRLTVWVVTGAQAVLASSLIVFVKKRIWPSPSMPVSTLISSVLLYRQLAYD